jgi:hypothetical protein
VHRHLNVGDVKKITRIGALPWRGVAGVVTFAEVSKEKALGLNPRRLAN